MSIQRIDSDTQKTTALRFFEGALLIICLCVLALRATYTESPYTMTINANQALGNNALSLLLSATLIFAAIAWLFAAFCRKQFVYRFSGIEIGLAIFLISSFFAYSAASNKRLAINDVVTLTAPIATALLLVQVLDSNRRIKLVLFVTIALAVTAVYQCSDQLLSTNQVMIEDYERNPQRHLDMIGAEKGSLKQFQYEHRLYSRDIKGFFTTSNSTGSFLILAGFAAVGLFIQKIKDTQRPVPAGVIWFGIAAVIIIAGIFLTRSKGTITAAILAGGMLTVYLMCSKLIAKYKTILLIICALIAAGTTALIVKYGVTHGRLPGGNSMLVRWQYWTGAANMYRDHPVTGVGGANFAIYYPRYKIPAASETVKDPHNFILSILTQYGPLGLSAFMAALAVPIYRNVFRKDPELPKSPGQQNTAGGFYGISLFSITLALLFLRPILVAADLGTNFNVKLSVIFLLYIAPFCIFAAVFLVLWLSENKIPFPKEPPISDLKPALCCGLAGVLIHNLIDFALFEPGVYTLFWTMIACLIATNRQNKKTKTPLHPAPFIPRLVCAVIIIIVSFAIISACIAPTVTSSAKIQQALRNPASAELLLNEASQDDKIDPLALNLAGRFCTQKFLSAKTKNTQLLNKAVEYFLKAARRDPENFNNLEKLSNSYTLISQNSPATEKAEALRSAYEYGTEALNRYPGSDRIHFKLAKIAEELKNTDATLKHYNKAVEIEDSYRQQFRIMYPEKEVFSRLGPTNYKLAKERIKELENRLNKPAEN